jgi:hypothetical protein
MAVDERRRKVLYDALERQIGAEAADTMMELLPPVGWADVATKDDLRQLELRLNARMDALRAELRGEMAELRGQLRGEMTRLQGELKSHTLRTILFVNIPSIIGAVALAFTATRLG